MKKLIIDRFKEYEDSTIGRATLIENNNILMTFFTLEPSGPDTIASNKNKRIPIGIYNTEWIKSSKSGSSIKGKLPVLFNEDVKKKRKILIHVGNKSKDTLGCILVGLKHSNNSLLNSKDCLYVLFDHLFEDEFIVEINNKFIHPKDNIEEEFEETNISE